MNTTDMWSSTLEHLMELPVRDFEFEGEAVYYEKLMRAWLPGRDELTEEEYLDLIQKNEDHIASIEKDIEEYVERQRKRIADTHERIKGWNSQKVRGVPITATGEDADPSEIGFPEKHTLKPAH